MTHPQTVSLAIYANNLCQQSSVLRLDFNWLLIAIRSNRRKGYGGTALAQPVFTNIEDLSLSVVTSSYLTSHSVIYRVHLLIMFLRQLCRNTVNLTVRTYSVAVPKKSPKILITGEFCLIQFFTRGPYENRKGMEVL